MAVTWTLLTFQFVHAICMRAANQAFTPNKDLVRLSDCVCPGYEVTYECTVCGGITTVWTGSLFDCTSDQIILRHSEFETGSASGECNNGAVTASNVGINIVNCSQCFISRLSFLARNGENNKTVSCNYFNGTSETVVGTATVILTTEPLPPPNDIHLSDIDQNKLTFTWSEFSSNRSPPGISCSDIVYNIIASSCGVCPNSTSSTTTTCTNITVDGSTCTFAIETEVCGNISRQGSNIVTVLLKVPDTPKVEVEQLLSSASSLSLIYATLSVAVNTSNAYDGIATSVVSYKMFYHDTISGVVCGTDSIPVSSSLCAGLICKHTYDVSVSACHSSTELTVTAFATNAFGDGPISSPVYVDLARLQLQLLMCNRSNSTDNKSGGDLGLLFTASLGSVALLALVLSSVVFTIVTVVLIKGKAKLARELRQVRDQIESSTGPGEATTDTVEYEDIMELSQRIGQVQADICTRDNVAYDNVSSK